jgi:hypothetical protein
MMKSLPLTRHRLDPFRPNSNRPRWNEPLGLVLLTIRSVSSGLIAWIGWIHLHLWLDGYRQIPTVGPFFLVAGIAGFLIAAGLLAWPSLLTGIAGIGLALGALGALIISATIGLFGFMEALSASFVSESIALEIAATLTLCAWIGLELAAEIKRGPPVAGSQNVRVRGRPRPA